MMMATYFHGGSEIHENLQTLYLMNPSYSYIAACSDTHSSHPQSNMLLLNPAVPNALIQGGGVPHAQPGQHFIAIPLSENPGRASSSPPSDRGRGPLTVSQGLSLSLSPQQRIPGVARGVAVGSKYLKAAQELLDEAVSVGYDHRGEFSCHKEKGKEAATARDGAAAGEGSAGRGSKTEAEQLSPAQRQDLQMKKAKLLNMLDEVEQRYRQYHSQIQAVVASLEEAAGIGSAKSYTSLASKTISRQFRCLKDTIASEIKATNKSLGEDDEDDGKGKPEGGIGSRLRLVDHQLWQQKALHQLGMMPHNNAWRPQRGLPERAVSVLRAWLFDHFLHPYPKDSDKHMLAKQTGLTRSQVSNWFINARVRLWKPMVEEMYMEEVKAQVHNNDNSDTTTTNSLAKNNHNKDHQPASKPTAVAQQQQQNHHGTKPGTTQTHQQADPQTTNDIDSLVGPARSPKKRRTYNNSSDVLSSPSSILSTDMEIKPPLDHQTNGPGGSGFNPVYIVNDIPGRFNMDHLSTGPYGNNGVSLTLGLPHCENLLGSQSDNHHQQGFLPNQLGRSGLEVGAQEADFWGISMGQPLHQATNNGYETIDIIQTHKRFAAHQLLHDFVA